MTAPAVDAAIRELMDFAWNVVYDLLEERGLLGDELFVEEYTGIHSWVEDLTRYTVVHSRTVAVLFPDTRPVDSIVFHHGLLGADDPKAFFTLPLQREALSSRPVKEPFPFSLVYQLQQPHGAEE
ncbi:hypothetical protein [Arthrobacter sp. ZGTC131]|uniref:hypothetical protein n=1 Tax=Arthrobacter sp. ZGTC131 TaxID=2058898 RepID=UPI002157E00C|nr:hypothetical protein [Arthrobacter sp. ZGTC131]